MKAFAIQLSADLVFDRDWDEEKDIVVQPPILSDISVSSKTLHGNRSCRHTQVRIDGLNYRNKLDVTAYNPMSDGRWPRIRYLLANGFGRSSSLSSGDGSFTVQYYKSVMHVNASFSKNSYRVHTVSFVPYREETTFVGNITANVASSTVTITTKTEFSPARTFTQIAPVKWYNYTPLLMPTTIEQVTGHPLVKGMIETVGTIAREDFSPIGELSLQAMNTFQPSPNSFSFLYELPAICQPLRAVKSFLSLPSAKNLANAYLANEYGTRLTAADTYAYISKFVRGSSEQRTYRKVHAREQNHITVAGVSAYCYQVLTGYTLSKNGMIADTAQALRDWGFLPSVSIAWDLVPMSFIADWFLPIGKALEVMDKTGIYESFTWVESIYTTRDEYVLPASLLFPGAMGSFKVIGYNRRVFPNMPRPAFSPDDINLSFRRILNGSTIAFQRW